MRDVWAKGFFVAGVQSKEYTLVRFPNSHSPSRGNVRTGHVVWNRNGLCQDLADFFPASWAACAGLTAEFELAWSNGEGKDC